MVATQNNITTPLNLTTIKVSSLIQSDDSQTQLIDDVKEQTVILPEADLESLFSTTTQTSIRGFTIPEEECHSCRSSRWTHVPHQIGSFTSKVLGKAAHAIVDPVLDKQKKKFLQPVLDRARSLSTAEEWMDEVSMRLNEEQNESTGRILEALRMWKPYSIEVRNMAHEIVHLWMMGVDTVLEHHLTTFAFLKINTRLEYVAEYHAKWLYNRYGHHLTVALWPASPPEFEFSVLVESFTAKLSRSSNVSTYGDYNTISKLPSHVARFHNLSVSQIVTILVSDLPEVAKWACACRWDWEKAAPEPVWSLLESFIPDTVKLECINRWEWLRVTPAEVIDFVSRNGINEVTMSVIHRIEWSSYSTDELERITATVIRQNTLLTVGHSLYARYPDGLSFRASFGWYQNWIETPTLTNWVSGHTDEVTSVVWSPDGKSVSSVCCGGHIRVWDSNTGRQLHAMALPIKSRVTGRPRIDLSPDGALGLCTWNGSVFIWDTASGRIIRKLERNHQISVAFHPNSSAFVSGSKEGSLHLWDVATGNELALEILPRHTGGVRSVKFSSDGEKIVSGSDDNTIRVWDTQSRQDILTLTGHTDTVTCAAITPDNRHIVSGSWDKTIRIWNAESGLQLRSTVPQLWSTWQDHPVYSIAISPDSTRIASGTKNHNLSIWDLESGEEVQLLQGHTSWISSVAFSPDGTKLVSGSGDCTVRIWDLKSGKEIYFPLVLNTDKALLD